jgi:hypothetical protein
MKALQRIIKFIRLPLKEKLLMGEAVFYLIWYSFLIYMVPFRWWESKIGKKMQSLNQEEMDQESLDLIRQVKRNVIRIRKYLGLGSCFSISLTIKNMLEGNGIYTNLFLGLDKDIKGQLVAHAWLSSGKFLIYGGKASPNKFAMLISYQ